MTPLLGFSRLVETTFERCAESLLAAPGCADAGLAPASRHLTLLGATVLAGDILEMDARLRRGRLSPATPMRLVLTRWSSEGGTLVELLPRRRPRTSGGYFRAGRAAIDKLAADLAPPARWETVTGTIDAASAPAGVAA